MKCNLSDICSFVNEKISLSELTKDTYISTENMLTNRGGITVASALSSITQTQAFKVGDVLVSNIRPYFKKIWHATFNGGCSNDVLVFRAKESIDSDFLYYVLADDAFFNYATGTSKGTKMPRGDKSAIMQYGVPNIALSLQTRIAHILKPIDNKISLNNAINHNLQQQAQLLYEHLLDGDITRHRLGDILTLLKDGTHNPPKRLEKGIPLITGQTLSNGFISYEKMTYIAESDYQTIHKTYQPIENDLILTKIGTVGKVAILRNSDLPIAVHCNSALLRFNSNIISQQWGFFLLNSSAFGIELRKKVTNTVQDFVSLGHLADIIITLPPAEVIKRYDWYFKTILETLSNNDFENRRLAMLRDALLPKLMSGEIDVSEVEL